ncbi:MAG: DNA polymerase III subunit delta' [Phycisphaerae bacterium]
MYFRDVQHQERALSLIRRGLRSGRTHHAYLFEGPEGVGKEMAANALAARLLCQGEVAADADACGTCPSCRLLAAGNHPDFHLIHRGLHKLHPDRSVRASKGLFLAVDLIRHFLLEPATVKPSVGSRRVFVIRDAERMNEGAQNALLKTLEEPPGETVLILVTSSAARLRPTIRSRCQCVPFGRLPADFVQQRLAAEFTLPPAEAETLARLADGRLGAAMRWHQIGLLTAVEEVGAALDGLADQNPEAFGVKLVDTAAGLATRAAQPNDAPTDNGDVAAEEDEEDAGPRTAKSKAVPTDELRDALKLAFMLVAAYERDALVASAAPSAAASLPTQRDRTARRSRQLSSDQFDAHLDAVTHAETMLDQNVAPQLVCERLAAALTGAAPVV